MIERAKVYNKYSSAMVVPSFTRVEDNLIIASFQLMKLVPAKYVIEKAIRENKIDPEYPLVETSSGTYALGLGIVCAEYGIPFYIISDPAIDIHLKRRLNALGGKVQILSQNIAADNIQIMRLNTLQDYLQHNKNAFWPCQYDNPDNRDAYSEFSENLLNAFGKEFTLVGTVGSGGSTSGTTSFLRNENANIKLVGVDTFGSILFGMPPQKRILRGLGNSILPKNLLHHLFDEIHWVSAENAFRATRYLHDKKGIFCGPTTGAAYHVAKWIANNNKNEQVVFISADTGHRYQSTVYNNSWLKQNNLLLDQTTQFPLLLEKPQPLVNNWAYMQWGRKSYEQGIVQ